MSEYSVLSIKQKAICIRMINSFNYNMWKLGLKKQWLIDEYNKLEKVIIEEDIVEEVVEDKSDFIEEFKLIKEDFSDIMESTLFDHQILRVNFFMSRLDNKAIEASSTGSGKTVTGLTYSEQLYLEGKIKHTYIICPLVMVEVWKSEILKHSKAKDLSKYTILNYEKITKSSFHLCDDSLLILDEAHKLKDSNGKRFKYLYLFNFKYILPMSATIIGNRYEELKAIYKIMDKKFPCKNGVINLDLLKNDLIRVSTDMLNLPELTIKDIPLSLDYKNEYVELETKILDEINSDKLKNGKNASNVLVKLLRLNQYCSNRNIIMEKEKPFVDQIKFKAILELLDDNPDEQFIIWANFVPTVQALYEELTEYYKCGCIYGDVKQDDRNTIIDKFKNGTYRILIANPSTLNAGITLINATRTIYVDHDFSAIKYIQSRGRNHRIGSKENCVVYNLFFKNSIEEKIVEVLKEKEGIINSILESGQNIDTDIINSVLKKMF